MVKDLTAQKYFRFGPTEVRVMRCFDGRRPASEIAASLTNEGLRISSAGYRGLRAQTGERRLSRAERRRAIDPAARATARRAHQTTAPLVVSW